MEGEDVNIAALLIGGRSRRGDKTAEPHIGVVVGVTMLLHTHTSTFLV